MAGELPPPVQLGGDTVVAVDVDAVDAEIVFDLHGREARCRATVSFTVGDAAGCPALDLRQPVDALELDGTAMPSSAFDHRDLGGGSGAEMRVLQRRLAAGSRHSLVVDYPLGTPAADGAEPLGFSDDGMTFDFWMSDLRPGRYLEMWLPCGLCQDRFTLDLAVSVRGTDRPHLLITNQGAVAGTAWRVRYPPTYTSLSPMCVLAPEDTVSVHRSPVDLPGRPRPLEVITTAAEGAGADVEACAGDIRSWLSYLATRYGPWTFGEQYVAHLWAAGRGMEYDGATTAAVAALEHEVFHSWFGRGVKPACAGDGWIDEAFTSWATTTRRSEEGRFAEVDLGLEEDPVVLYPSHPWSRYTPTEAYTAGARLFAGVASLLGGADRLRTAMESWYRAHAGGFVTTDGLAAHLSRWGGIDLTPWWERYVHGRA